MTRRRVSNPLALAVLGCLIERPMHPYEISTTLRSRGKQNSIKLNYGSLYSVVEALQKHGLICSRETTRTGRRPERTVYEITPAGITEFEEWLAEREARAGEGERALFVGRGGRRLSKRSVDDVVRGLGEDAGVKLSAHALRHTFLTRMVRQGSDLVLVAELAGHRRLETTRRYSLPSDADRLLAVERLQIDF